MAEAKKQVKKAVKPKVDKVVEKQVEVKEVKVEKKAEKKVFAIEFPSLEEMLEAGAHFGHSVKRRNPKMDEYVYATKNGVQIMDLVKTKAALETACQYLAERVASGANVLLLGTKSQAVEAVREAAEATKMPHIVNRWVGGLFTNWGELKKRIDKLNDMRVKMEAGEYKKYTKKEQVLLAREIERLDRMYGGVAAMKELPKVLFVVDPTRETTAMREAQALGITIVAVVDTNANPEGIKYLIPANDDSLKTVKLLVEAVARAIEAGIKARK